MGNTILCKQIRTETVKEYIKEAVKHFTSQGQPDPTLNITGYRAPIIQGILNESERWESVANRREPLTWPMVDHIRSLTKSKSADSLDHAMADWLTVGMFTGFRLSEWAQADSVVAKKTSQGKTPWKLSRKHDSIAITRSDVSFGKALNGNDYVAIKYRWQKNGENGEKVLYGASQGNPSHCPVLAMHNIIRRAERFKIPNDAPLAWFAENKQRHLITDKHICTILRPAARAIYQIENRDDINRWSAHSIRVGACVLLHEQGAEPMLIKNQLRWRSDTFLTYLRHTPQVAFRHAALITNA
jgi:hypothetical protein